MPWLVVILTALFMIGPVWFVIIMCDTFHGRIGYIILFGALSILLAFSTTATCRKMTMLINEPYILSSEPKEVIEIDNFYITEDGIIALSVSNESYSFNCYTNNCIKLSEATEKQYIEIYEGNKWVSSIKQFLYGDAPTIYKIHVFPQTYAKGELND